MLNKPFISFGEVLWDVFPDGKKLGGAPLNFSYYFQEQGGNPKILSAVGNDEYGREILNETRNLGIDTNFIGQVEKPTGIVDISLNENRHTFKIRRDTAWEYISYPNT